MVLARYEWRNPNPRRTGMPAQLVDGSASFVGLFDRFRADRRSRAGGPVPDLTYLRQWVAQRSGVEGFIEPKTTVTDLTVVLVAGDGEWTRRRVGGEHEAKRLSDRLRIPVYDVQRVGYPQRMRDFDERRRIERRRALRDELEG
jgi:hypothetical protein